MKSETISTKEMMAELNRLAKAEGGQRALADKWGITYQSISNCLTGYKLPSPRILKKLKLIPVKEIKYRYKRTKRTSSAK